MPRCSLATWMLFLAAAFAAGCGAGPAEVEVADSPPVARPVKPNPPRGVDEPPDPREAEELAREEERYAEWLRSDYVKNLDPAFLEQDEDWSSWPFGPARFEDAVDEADLVVSGRVAALLFVPDGTLTTFEVDRAAKGRSPSRIYVMQTSHLRPGKDREARLMQTPATSLLVSGDRAVLVLKEYRAADLMPGQADFLGDRLDDVPVYGVVRGAGQYRSAGGTVRTEAAAPGWPEPDHSWDGRTETELLDAAELRAPRT